jgi:hypothetical protein
MNSKAKGEVSEGHVIASLLNHGYSLSVPFGDNQRYDLIVDDGERLWRAQVKTGRIRGGCLRFNCASINVLTQHRISYHGQIDLFLVYSPDTGKVYRVPIGEAPNAEMSLRLQATKGTKGPRSTIRWAADYELTSRATRT